eukprot:11360315-Alexandrium_andersonii.AAC.1
MATARRPLPPSPRSAAFRQRCSEWRTPLPKGALLRPMPLRRLRRRAVPALPRSPGRSVAKIGPP